MTSAKKKTTAKKTTAKKTTAKKATAKKATAKKTTAKKTTAKKAPAKKTTAKKAPAKKAPTKKPMARADYGAPIDGFFAKQPAHLRPILDELRRLIEEAAPEAESSIKWGMPVYTLRGTMLCALGGHKAHVNLILSGPPGTYADPDGLLSPEGKSGRHLKLTKLEELPHEAVRGWLRTAVVLAQKGV